MKRPAPLWPAWERVARRMAAAARVGLFSDFDGTLAPLARHPGQARLPARTRQILQRLRRRPRVKVGVVSGRSLRDLRRKIRLSGIYYVGSHGLEWAKPGGRRYSKVGGRSVRYLQELGQRLEVELGRLPGLYVERKTLSVAIHYRNAAPRVARRAQRTMERVARESRRSLRLLRGKKILELLPAGRTSKGQTVMELVTRLRETTGRRSRVIYLGDDTTDETVFARLKAGDLGIHVGSGEKSRAGYRLDSPEEVTRFLHRLDEVVR